MNVGKRDGALAGGKDWWNIHLALGVQLSLAFDAVGIHQEIVLIDHGLAILIEESRAEPGFGGLLGSLRRRWTGGTCGSRVIAAGGFRFRIGCAATSSTCLLRFGFLVDEHQASPFEGILNAMMKPADTHQRGVRVVCSEDFIGHFQEHGPELGVVQPESEIGPDETEGECRFIALEINAANDAILFVEYAYAALPPPGCLGTINRSLMILTWRCGLKGNSA